jgi:hypothetical protein
MPRKISAQEIGQDIRSGMDDFSLMKKYGLSCQALRKVFGKLVDAQILTQSEIDQRNSLSKEKEESGASKDGEDLDEATISQFNLDEEPEAPTAALAPHGINSGKIVAFTGLTWIGFAALAILYCMVVAQPGNLWATMTLIAMPLIWALACLLMGLFLAYRLRKWTEVLFGILFFVLAMIPFAGIFFGLGYFAWAYVKLERLRMVKADNEDASPT